MKKMTWKKTAGAVALSAVLALGLLPAAGAASTPVSAYLSPDVTIVVDDISRTFYNAQGNETHPVMYNGTTYLPIRAIGELMGKNVNWDQAALTVTLAGERTTGNVAGTPDPDAQPMTVTAYLRPDVTIVVDDVPQSFADANGNVVYPLLYNGSVYLPIRSIGVIMDKDVGWDGTTRTVTLSGGSLVTDADTFEPGAGNNNNNNNNNNNTGTGTYIGEEAAKAKALAHAGLQSSQVTFIRCYLERDDGRMVYDVEFYTADYKEYDYEIDATTGAILSYDYDADHYTPPSTGTYIGEAAAKSKALAHAGLQSSQVTFVRCTLERDDGRMVYDVEFYTADYKEYDYEIDATTGAILSYDYDADHYTPPATGGTALTEAQIKAIALAQVPGATASNIYKFERDYDDGRLEYEVKIVYGTLEYEFEISSTGTILSRDVESIYD